MGPIVSTPSGRLEGTQGSRIQVFKGIPYARPPTGGLRFRAPEPVEPWSGVRPAQQFGKAAPQVGRANWLVRTFIGVADVALWEINEAFAAVPVAACKKLGISADIVNVLGSGCSIGHPVAASGARMILSLINELRRRGGGYGVAAMCAGGGQAGAVVIDVPAPANR